MITTRGRRKPGEPTRSGSEAEAPGSGVLRSWVIVALIAVGIWAVFFGVPSLVRHLNAPPISEDFGLEDAVVALRLYADDVPYLVLVDESGEARSVQLDERGFEESRLVWSDAGLSTGGPDAEYVLRADGLTRLTLPDTPESTGERARFATADGFAVYNGSAVGYDLSFIDATADRLTTTDLGYSSPTLAACDSQLVLVDETGPRTVTPQTEDFEGFDVFDGVGALVCEDDRLYGFDEIVDAKDSAHQILRTWDRASGERSEAVIRYPDTSFAWMTGTPFVWEGRLHWAADTRLWSIPVAGGLPSGSIEAEAGAELGGSIDDLSPVVGSDEDVLAHAGGRVFGVAEETDFKNPRRGPAYDQLLNLAVFSADAATGERRIELDIDGIDFPERDIHVTAIAVNPEWAARR